MEPNAIASGRMTMPTDDATPQRRSRTCVVIAGMHRSGTSAAARVVNLLGAEITKGLMPTVRDNNETGFWESLSLWRIHDNLLAQLGSSWDDPGPLPKDWLKSEPAQATKRALGEELAKDFPTADLFMVKDPRISRLLPIWLQLLGDRDIRPVVVLPYRNPLEVSASLQRRDGLPAAQCHLLYIRNSLEAEKASRGLARLFVSYYDILWDWRRFAARLQQSVLPHVLNLGPETAAEIDSFLRPDLRHHHLDDGSSEALSTLPPAMAEIYEQTKAAATAGDSTEFRASFDRIARDVDKATGLYHGLLVAEKARHQDVIGELQGTLEALQRSADAQAASSEKLQAETESQEQEIAELRAKVAKLEARLAERSEAANDAAEASHNMESGGGEAKVARGPGHLGDVR